MPKKALAAVHVTAWVLLGLLATLALPEPSRAASAAPPEAARALPDEEIVKEFKKYFRKYKDTPTRVEAVLSLEGTESVKVVNVLLPVLKDKDQEVANAAIRVISKFETRAPVDRLLEVLETNKDSVLRTAILRAIADANYGNVTEALIPCLEDSSWSVRRRAVQALVVTRDAAVTEAIAPLALDKETAVRCAALEGLADLAWEKVVPLAIADLSNETWQVRASAIYALEKVRHGDSIGPLIEQMAVEEGRLVADIGRALSEITGRNFGQRLDGWQNFWRAYKGKFQIPTDAELAKLREKQKERKEEYQPVEGSVTYHGVETPSRSILFVIDQSGSMEQEVVEKDRYRDGDYPSFKRIDIVKTELQRTVDGLESYVKYNIIAFATGVKQWKKKLVKANVLNKDSAKTWAKRLEALGGASKEDLASVGLTGSANLEAGKTNTYDALMTALGVAGRGASDKNYEVAVDTIFFLSDGRPSHGKFVDTEDILREVRTANELRKVVIHTIAIGEFEKDFMRRLAEENGGVFVDLGR